MKKHIKIKESYIIPTNGLNYDVLLFETLKKITKMTFKKKIY